MSPDRSPQRRADAPLPLAPRPLRRTARLGALFAAFGLGLGALVVAPDAEAQVPKKARVQGDSGDGLDDHLFRPALDSKGFFSVNGADILGSGDVSFGLVIDYGHGLMEMNEGYGSDYLVEHAFQGTFHFDYGIGNLAVVGISAPVVLNAGDTATGIGPTGATYDDDKLDAQALGQFSAHGKIRILRPDGPLGLALLVQVGTEVAGADDLAAEPGFFYWPQLALEKRFGASQAFRLGLNAGYRGHTGKNAAFGLGANGEPQLVSGVLEYSNLITGNFGMSYRVFTPLDLVAETYITQQAGGGSDSKQKLSAEAIGGIKLFIERSSFLMIGGGVGYTNGFQAADQRGVLGFVFEPSIGDRDGDGIKDDLGRLPRRSGGLRRLPGHQGRLAPRQIRLPRSGQRQRRHPRRGRSLPEQPRGSRTAITTTTAAPKAATATATATASSTRGTSAPTTRKTSDGFEDKDGCPDPDNDEDGILDKVDLCPNDPEDKDGFEDETAAPTRTTIATRSSTSSTSARWSPRSSTAAKTRTAAPTRAA
jgi:OOP family OmpA-OmpF porin